MQRKSSIPVKPPVQPTPEQHSDEKNEHMELEKTAFMFKRMVSVSMAEEMINLQQRENIKAEVEETTQSAFSAIGR